MRGWHGSACYSCYRIDIRCPVDCGGDYLQKSRFDLTGINEVVGIFADAEGHEARRA